MAFNNSPLVNRSNADIFNAVRNDLSGDFRNRIPAATQGNLSQQLAELDKFRPRMNEFMDGLVNRIGSVVARSDKMWNNPLAEFKMPTMAYGSTIEEYAVGLLKAHVYDHDRESMERDVWGTELPVMESNFHTITRQEKYKVSVKNDILRRAFLTDGGLASFVEQLMEAPVKSDQWDEFLQTVSLFSEYERNGGFYHMRIPEVSALSSTADEARQALRRMRGLADTMPFLSTKYNAAGFPVHCDPNDLVLFCTPEFKAAVDVEALAGAFNVSKMDTYGRIFPIPKEYFGIEGCEAVLTTKDFFVIADTLVENTSIFNPDNLQSNYWLHHHEIISASRFVPAVMFSTMYDDEAIEVKTTVTGLSAITATEDEDGDPVEFKRGGTVQLEATPQGTGAAELTGVTWSLTGNESVGTYMTPTGVLRIAGNETSDELVVTAATSWVNPESPYMAPFTKTFTVAVTGDLLPEWPVDHADVHDDADDAPNPIVVK